MPRFNTFHDVALRSLQDADFLEALLDNPVSALAEAGLELSMEDQETLANALTGDTLPIEVDLKEILKQVKKDPLTSVSEVWPTEVWPPIFRTS